MKKIVIINEKDNCAVALHALGDGEVLSIDGNQLIIADNIPRGHKFALKDIEKGDRVVKYGYTIGTATESIHKGQHIHTHNIATTLSNDAGESYIFKPDTEKSSSKKIDSKLSEMTFSGYIREDGRAGIRNEVWILPLVGCVSDVCRAIAKAFETSKPTGIDGIYAFTHPYGCSQTGEDHDNTKKILSALALHPNAAAVLVVALGCENLTLEQFKDSLKKEQGGEINSERIKFMVCQDCEDEISSGIELVNECILYARRFHRQPLPLYKLTVGMKCGGSDGLSGITANPAVGVFSDYITSAGGTTVLTEVPEMFGAEQILLNRCKNKDVYNKAVNMIKTFKNYFTSHGEVIYENPSPGNKAGGISTLEDKSCGCVQKGGRSTISDVLSYGDRIKTNGLNLLYGPGNDLVSCTALAAAGAQLILFTTGRGTPFGAPVPTVKISTNSSLYNKKRNWIDFNAGVLVDDNNKNVFSVGKEILDEVIEIASGRETRNEINNYRELTIFKNGVTL